jgi:transcriptional regulator GlxA family with amidase domain
MRRRELIRNAVGLAGLGVFGRAASSPPTKAEAGCVAAAHRVDRSRVRVGFLISDSAKVIDFCGPWEVFQDVILHRDGMHHPFELYTVAESRDVIRASGGLRVVPDYTINDAPLPHVLVVPAMEGTRATHAWIRKVSETNHITMSVCTGAFQLARAGLLDGLTATTHHDYQDEFAGEFPTVRVVKDVRFVEHERIATAAGLTAGVDLALRVVERYHGREVAQATAEFMEHDSEGWKVAMRRSSRVQVVA